VFFIPSAVALDDDLLPPVAKFTPSVENVLIFENVTFDASASYDPNELNLTYSWDFDDSDGFQSEASGRVVDHSFKKVGPYVVTLKVNNGNIHAIATKDIVVYAGSDRIYPPVAIINTSVPLNGTILAVDPDTNVEFRGENSYDPNSDRLFYEWTFSDGGNGSGPVVNHDFTRSGWYNVTLTVTTSTGKTDSTVLTVNVRGPVEPPSEPGTQQDSNAGLVVFIIILIILGMLIVGGIVAFLFISQRRGGEMGEGEETPRSRFRSMQDRRPRQKKRARRPERMTELKRKERRIGRKIDEEKEDLDKEMKSAFAGFKEIFSKPKEEPEEDKKRGLAVRRQREQPRQIPVRGPPKKPEKPAVTITPKRGSLRKDDQLKKEIERETSKLESFLSDILTAPKKEDQKDKKKPGRAMPSRTSRMLPPPKVPKTPPRQTPPSRPSRDKKGMTDEDIKKELKAMEMQMDKEITAMFKKKK
jgi:PKD repeat protein